METSTKRQRQREARNFQTKNLDIPVDIMEEILLNLPLKSLLRFSSVSKFWNSMIFESRSFVKRYRGLERIVFRPCTDDDNIDGSTVAHSFIPSAIKRVLDTSNFICPFSRNPIMKAMCEELWFAFDGASQSFFLWNPSIRMHKKLMTNPAFIIHSRIGDQVFGIGYDSVGDDYKILKIPRLMNEGTNTYTELYSVRSDSWRKISPATRNVVDSDHGFFVAESTHGVFVSGKLHWKVFPIFPTGRGDPFIMSFDLSKEELGVVAPPPQVAATWRLCVLRGMLCMSMSNENEETNETTSSIWMMEDYAVGSWTEKFRFDCSSIFDNDRIFPLYLYENGDVLVRTIAENEMRIFVYRHEKGKADEKNYRSNWGGEFSVLPYVDSVAAAAAMQSAEDWGLRGRLAEGEAGESSRPRPRPKPKRAGYTNQERRRYQLVQWCRLDLTRRSWRNGPDGQTIATYTRDPNTRDPLVRGPYSAPRRWPSH